MDEYIIMNFSGGKDSTAMILHAIEIGEHIDEVVCCDVQKEFPAMYRHIEKVRKVIENRGIKFTLLRPPKSFDYYMYDYQPKRKNHQLLEQNGLSWPGPVPRWCTSKLKTEIVRKYITELSRTKRVIQCVGIAADEKHRLERKNNQNANHRHPLVEWGWTEKECLIYCYSRGFDWEGLYEIFNRVSCWCCPLQSLEELRKLRKNFPDLWDELREMDRKTWRKFKPAYSVQQLDERFAFEEEREAQGLPITTREFYCELRKRLNADK